MAEEQGTKNVEISDSDKLGEVTNILRDAIKRFDSLDERMDALEARGDKGRRDAADEVVENGEPAEPTVDKARKDAEEAEKAEADKARKDAEDEEERCREDKRRSDAEEKEKAEMDRRADARRDAEMESRNDSLVGQVADLKAKLDRMTPRVRSDGERDKLATIQEQAEPAFQSFSDRAPAPMDGETSTDYQRRLASKMQKHSPKWGQHRLNSISDEGILDTVVGEIYADAISASRRGAEVVPGELREVITRSLAGHTRIEFQGDSASWMGPLAGDSMRATGKFHTPV